MPDRQHPERQSHDLESPVAGKPAEESPLPGLDNMLREAADDATRRTILPPYDLVQGLIRRRRAARVATGGVFGVALLLVVGVAAVAGVGPQRDEVRPQPAATATVLDPSLREYWTTIPVLSWTPKPGYEAEDVTSTEEYRTAVFSALGPGDHDFSVIKDLRTVFPDSPAGGPAVAIDQSVTRAELERAAANLRKVDGVQDARVVQMPGLWFTVSATALAAPGTRVPVIDVEGTGVRGSASGRERDAQDRLVNWVRATYLGPAIDRATFDLLRARAAEAVQVDVSQVVVTAESSDRNPEPTTS